MYSLFKNISVKERYYTRGAPAIFLANKQSGQFFFFFARDDKYIPVKLIIQNRLNSALYLVKSLANNE